METEISINDLANTIDEIKSRLTDVATMSHGWSTSTLIIIVMIAVAISIVFFVIFSKIKDNSTSIINRTNELKEVKDGIKTELKEVKDGIKTELREIKDDIKTIQSDIKNLYLYRDTRNFTDVNSPITLNEKGLSLAKEIQVQKIIEKNYTQFKEKVCNAEYINAYNIQQNCFDLSKEIIKNKGYFQDNEYDTMERLAFENGTTIESFYIMFGILLRDKILEEKNLSYKDINLHSSDNSTNNR